MPGLLESQGGSWDWELDLLFLNNFEEIQFTYKHVTHPAKMLSYLSIICLSTSCLSLIHRIA